MEKQKRREISRRVGESLSSLLCKILRITEAEKWKCPLEELNQSLHKKLLFSDKEQYGNKVFHCLFSLITSDLCQKWGEACNGKLSCLAKTNVGNCICRKWNLSCLDTASSTLTKTKKDLYGQ